MIIHSSHFFRIQQQSQSPVIPIRLRGEQEDIMQVLKERNLWLKMEGAVMGLVFFLSVQKTQFELGAI